MDVLAEVNVETPGEQVAAAEALKAVIPANHDAAISRESLVRTQPHSLPGPFEFSRNRDLHKVSNVGIFVLLKFENKLDIVISHINFISKHHDKCKCALKFVHLVTFPNLFPIEVV